MALSDLKVYSEYAYTSMTEVLRQQIALFNAASENTIRLSIAAKQGDFDESAFWKLTSDIVRRRNAYGSGTVSEVTLTQDADISVKVAAGTPPIRMDPGQFRWIQRNPAEAGVVVGRQMAVASMRDMLNTALGAATSALSAQSAVVFDATATGSTDASFSNLNKGQALFGDRSSDIQTWVMHSTPMHKLYENSLANTERLFTFETVNVIRDPFGKLLIMTDSPALVNTTPDPAVYSVLGLVPGAISVERNNDFEANEETKNGNENIVRTYQAEWSYNLSVKGFAWDKANGGKSPNDAALFTATNWDRNATSEKDLAGVLIKLNNS